MFEVYNICFYKYQNTHICVDKVEEGRVDPRQKPSLSVTVSTLLKQNSKGTCLEAYSIGRPKQRRTKQSLLKVNQEEEDEEKCLKKRRHRA